MTTGTKRLSQSLIAGLALTCLTLPAAVTAGQKLTILHTNDHHGRFWPNKHGEYGMPARKSLIDSIRAEVESDGGQLLLLSGGDINTGVPESDLQDAEPDFKGMTKIGYDAMAIGNHEFDNPLSVLRQQQKWADFPLLSANIYQQSSGERLFEPYKIFELEGLKVAVLGLTTEDTAKVGNPEYLNDIEFRNPIVEASKLVPSLQQQADIVIAATHMGHYTNGRHGINAPGDVSLARTVPGLDMIIGGHSQDPVCMAAQNKANDSFKAGEACQPDMQNGTLIMQAHEWGKYVGRADLEYDNGELKLLSYRLIPVNLKKKVKIDGKKQRVFIEQEIPADQELQAFLEPYKQKGQQELEVVIANTDKQLEGDRKIVRFRQSNLGSIIASAQKSAMNADLAVMNSGGIRDGIEAGDISYKDVLKVQPFGNTVCSVELSGSELLNYLQVTAGKPTDSGAFAHFVGVSLKMKDGELHDVKINGEPLSTAKSYKLALNSFIASGGDGYPKMTHKFSYVNSGLVDAEVLKAYLQKNSPIKAAKYDKANTLVKRN